MPIVQSAYNDTPKRGPGDQGSTQVRASFTTPTTPGAYVLAIVTTAGGLEINHSLSNAGFSQLKELAVRDLQVSVWGRAGSPPISSLTAYADAYRSMTLRVLELSAVAQASAVDKNIGSSGESDSASTGTTDLTTRADETIIAVLANQYSSTTQSGFGGGLTKIYEDVSPDGGTQDWEQSRTTVHQLLTSSTGMFGLSAQLSTTRRWIGVLIALKGSTIGPAKLTSLNQAPWVVTGGRGALTVFGPMRSTAQAPWVIAGGSVRARIGPANYQYLLGGWSGLLIGAGTDYSVESVEGLEGVEVRSSDEDFPRSDGALRGVDLQAARQIVFKVNWSGTRQQIEDRAAALLRTLVPQRDTDGELIFRHPGQPLKTVYCRPTNTLRGLDPVQVLMHTHTFQLRAADPRHYSATTTNLPIPITTNRDTPVLIQAINMGSGLAYPTIRIDGPAAGAPATRVVATNTTNGLKFDVAAVLAAGSSLVGDMRQEIAGLPVSPVTIDGKTKYAAWQLPREPLVLEPGINNLMFEVEPAGATPVCTLEFRSTWPG